MSEDGMALLVAALGSVFGIVWGAAVIWWAWTVLSSVQETERIVKELQEKIGPPPRG